MNFAQSPEVQKYVNLKCIQTDILLENTVRTEYCSAHRRDQRAYALSAGGPVIEPDLECIEMTLICPHSLFSRATLFSAERKLCIRPEGSEMHISVDGGDYIEIEACQQVKIIRGRHNIKFIDLIGNTFHESLCKKMMKPIK